MSSCHVDQNKRDLLLWFTSLTLAISYILALGPSDALELPKFIVHSFRAAELPRAPRVFSDFKTL